MVTEPPPPVITDPPPPCRSIHSPSSSTMAAFGQWHVARTRHDGDAPQASDVKQWDDSRRVDGHARRDVDQTAIVASTLILVQRATNQIERSSVAVDAARLVSESLDRELRSADFRISEPGENIYSAHPHLRHDDQHDGIRDADIQSHLRRCARFAERHRDTSRRVRHAPRTVITEVGPAPLGPGAVAQEGSDDGAADGTVQAGQHSAANPGHRHPDPIETTAEYSICWTTIAGKTWWRRCTPSRIDTRRAKGDRGSALVMAAINLCRRVRTLPALCCRLPITRVRRRTATGNANRQSMPQWPVSPMSIPR